MNCPEKETLQRLAGGELPQSDAAPINAHLEGCETCRADLETLSEVGALFERFKPAPPDQSYWGALPGQINKRRLQNRSKLRRKKAAKWAASIAWAMVEAAALLCIVCAASFFRSYRSETIAMREAEENSARRRVAATEEEWNAGKSFYRIAFRVEEEQKTPSNIRERLKSLEYFNAEFSSKQ